MPKIPDTIGNYVPLQPSNSVASYDPTIVTKSVQGLTDTLDRQKNIGDMQDAANRSNQAKRKVIDFLYGDGTEENPGLYSQTGGNAVGSGKKFDEFFQGVKSQALDGITNPIAQQSLEKELDGLQNSNIATVKNHEMQQSRAYSAQLMADQQSLAAQNAGVQWNSDRTFTQSLNESDVATHNLALMAGAKPGDSVYETMIQQGRTEVIRSRLLGQIKSMDPALREKAYDDYEKKYRPMMTLQGVQQMDGVFSAALPQIHAYKAYNSMVQGTGIDSADTKTLADAMQHVESNGQQFSAAGKPTTSGKGAVGIMQLMPDTAQEAAKMAGVPWDENKFKTDATYNRKLGETYLSSMQNKFGNNILAMAAYNAGPGIVDDWINGTNKSGKNGSKLKLGDPRTGETNIDKFVAGIPFMETRQYVSKVSQAMGAGTGIINPQQAQNEAAKLPEYAQKDFLSLVTTHNQQVQAQADQKRKSLMDNVLNAMSNGTTYAAMPAEMRAQLQSAGLAQQVQSYNPTAPSDTSTLTYLHSLDPKTLAQTDLNTPDIRLKLSPQDYTAWQQKQSSLSSPAMMATQQWLTKSMRDAFARRGISLQGKVDNSDPENPVFTYDGNQQFIHAHDLVDQQIDAYSAQHNGQYPAPAELQKMVDNVFTNLTVQVPGMLWGTNSKDISPYQMTLDQVPAEAQQQIIQSFKKIGKTPTEQAIIMAYLKKQGMQND